MILHWKNLLFWIGAILLMVLATVFYQPAAASTGSLLIWTRNMIYVMDIDSLHLNRVGAVEAEEQIVPSPGCYQAIDVPCWVVGGQSIYQVNQKRDSALPTGEGFEWHPETAISWSPDGSHVAYSVFNIGTAKPELRIYDASLGKEKLAIKNVDPTVGVTWSSGCTEGLDGENCHIGYKTAGTTLVALTPQAGEEKEWELPLTEEVFGLRWSPDDTLLYSNPQRYFKKIEDQTPAYEIPSGGELANMSPDGKYTVYYLPFRLIDCPEGQETCLHLGVWLNEWGQKENPRLIYNVRIEERNLAGLTFVPIWSPTKDSFVFFLDGKLIYYNVPQEEATIWYKGLEGKLRSLPVFAPEVEAVAFVDSEGQGYSEHRLVIINPRLQPIEHIIDTQHSFRILAWLPQ